jgi:hypothetical protein
VGGDVSVVVELSARFESAAAQRVVAEITQALQELGVADSVSVTLGSE